MEYMGGLRDKLDVKRLGGGMAGTDGNAIKEKTTERVESR